MLKQKTISKSDLFPPAVSPAVSRERSASPAVTATQQTPGVPSFEVGSQLRGLVELLEDVQHPGGGSLVALGVGGLDPGSTGFGM